MTHAWFLIREKFYNLQKSSNSPSAPPPVKVTHNIIWVIENGVSLWGSPIKPYN